MTVSEIRTLLETLRGIFTAARIVDPESKEVLEPDPVKDELRVASLCHSIWKKDCRCANCTTLHACRSRITGDKYEKLGSEVYHVTSKPLEIDGRILALEVVTRLDDVTDINRREALLHAQERNMEIIAILASEYSSVYYIDFNSDSLTPYSMNDSTREFFKDTFARGITYSEAFGMYVANAFQEDLKNAQDVGMNAHLAKPIDVEELIRTLSSVLSKVRS